MDHKMQVLVGDVDRFYGEYLKFEQANTIHEKHISSQLTQMPNPQYVRGVTSGTQPEFITTVIISAVIFFNPKEN